MPYCSPLTLTPLAGIPLIQPGDDLAEIILSALPASEITLQENDILVLAQKIVSKAEGRQVNFRNGRSIDKSGCLCC